MGTATATATVLDLRCFIAAGRGSIISTTSTATAATFMVASMVASMVDTTTEWLRSRTRGTG